MKLLPTTIDDIGLISEWSALDFDETHRFIKPDWWLTPNGFLSTKIVDADRTVFFVRFDQESDFLIMNTLLWPTEQVYMV
jgi:hypothetical protein